LITFHIRSTVQPSGTKGAFGCMIPKDEMEWSRRMFGECELGDARRTERLVEVAALMSKQMGKSLAKSCQGDGAALLGGYRLLRNDDVKPEAIRAGGFAEVAQRAQAHSLLLAVEDTTRIEAPPSTS